MSRPARRTFDERSSRRWFEHAICWQVYPLGFTGAPVRPSGDHERVLTHRLRHLLGWLDHQVELGTNALLLGPIFASSTHGYDATDHFAIDPRLGDDAGGAENVAVAAAESENPERDVPRAARAMIVRLVLFYVGAIAIVVTLQPWQASAASKGTVTESPFVKVLSLVNVPGAPSIMTFILITAALSAGNGCLYAATRHRRDLQVGRLGLPQASHRLTGGPVTAVVALAVMLAIYVAIAFIPSLSFALPYGLGYVVFLTVAYFLVRTRVKTFGPSVLDDELVDRAADGTLPDNAEARARAEHALVRIERVHGKVAAANDGQVPPPPTV